MDFERFYNKLPDKIKYNNYILKTSLNFSKKLRKLNLKNDQLDSQSELLNILFKSCNIKPSGTLRNIQLLTLELLKFVDNVCKKHNIEYWLDGGALLGSVRHSGFIPWDDDVDIAMMREEYEKIIEVLPKEISRFKFFKENCILSKFINNNDNYYIDFLTVDDVEDKENFLPHDKHFILTFSWAKPYCAIDFFPRDFVKDEKLESFKKNYIKTKYKFNQDVKNNNKDFFTELNLKNEEIGFTKSKTNYISDSLDVLQLSPLRIYKTEDIFPLKDFKFEDSYFKVPNNSGAYLSEIYGDYRNIPKVIDHHNMYDFVKTQFDSYEEMEKYFHYCILYLKRVNETFKNESDLNEV